MRFFHKFSSINYKFFGLVDNIMISCKRKQKFTKAINYLSKYLYVLDNQNIIPISDKYPDKIWQCWFQGRDNMPDIVKKCTDSVRKYHGDDVIFLENNNLESYIKLPDYIVKKHRNGIIPHANFSDMLRLSLLAKYGGCWIDSTILLTGKIPNDILNSDFFTFRSLKSGVLNNIDNLKQYNLYCNNFNSDISIESPYFIKANAGNEIINGVLSLFFEYWKHENRVIDYLMIDKFFLLTVLYNRKNKEQFLNMPVYYLENVLLLQHAQFEEFNQDIYEQIKSTTTIHKMTHKNLKRNPSKNSFLQYIINNDESSLPV